MDFKTKCPLCNIGFEIFADTPDTIHHLDILWTPEAGQMFLCEDKDALKPHIVYAGDRYVLSKEMSEWFEEQADKFYSDPSGFSKSNCASGQAATALLGSFARYSPYMDRRDFKPDASEVGQKLFDEGKNFKEIFDEITTEVK